MRLSAAVRRRAPWLAQLPTGWQLTPLSDLVDSRRPICYGVVQPGDDMADGVPLIRSGDVQPGKISEGLRRIPASIARNYRRSSLRGGEVVVSLVGNPGQAARVPAHLAGANIARQVGLVAIPDTETAAFVEHYLNSHVGRTVVLSPLVGSAQQVVNLADLKETAVPMPPRDQLRTIVGLAEEFSGLGRHFEALIDAKRAFKRGLMQQLFTGRKRFPEFQDQPWKLGRFDTLCEELTDRNGAQLGADSVMGVIKGVGFQPMRERVRGKGDLTRYKVVPPGAFAYNPMRLNIGSIAYNDRGRAILVSPDYEVFRARPGSAWPEFVDQLRHSYRWANYMKRAGAGGVRVRIYFSDLATLRFPTPSIDEQKAIAGVLLLADSEIDQLAQLHELIEAQRRALLSKLLSGEITVPS